MPNKLTATHIINHDSPPETKTGSHSILRGTRVVCVLANGRSYPGRVIAYRHDGYMVSLDNGMRVPMPFADVAPQTPDSMTSTVRYESRVFGPQMPSRSKGSGNE